jgi:hypothetical protein
MGSMLIVVLLTTMSHQTVWQERVAVTADGVLRVPMAVKGVQSPLKLMNIAEVLRLIVAVVRVVSEEQEDVAAREVKVAMAVGERTARQMDGVVVAVTAATVVAVAAAVMAVVVVALPFTTRKI